MAATPLDLRLRLPALLCLPQAWTYTPLAGGECRDLCVCGRAVCKCSLV